MSVCGRERERECVTYYYESVSEFGRAYFLGDTHPLPTLVNPNLTEETLWRFFVIQTRNEPLDHQYFGLSLFPSFSLCLCVHFHFFDI